MRSGTSLLSSSLLAADRSSRITLRQNQRQHNSVADELLQLTVHTHGAKAVHLAVIGALSASKRCSLHQILQLRHQQLSNPLSTAAATSYGDR
jgi:hypothetical protein